MCSSDLSGNAKHAIAVDDYLRVRKGVTLVVENASKDGIHTNDGVIIEGGLVNVTASSDGLEAEENGVIVNGGKIIIKSGDEGIVSSFEGDNVATPSNVVINQGDINITTTGEKAHAIKSDQDLLINGGTIIATVSGNASKGLSSNGNMTIAGGNMVLTTTGGGIYEDNDTKASAGIKCDGNLLIERGTINCTSSGAGGKGISADGTLVINGGNITVYTSGGRYTYSTQKKSSPKGIKSQGNLTINGGVINVSVVGKSEGSEGIESKAILTINDGTVEVYAYDDAMNASRSIVINGGRVYCYAENNDGIDSNGTLTVTGGLVISSGTRSPEEGFDCDNNTFTITGGVLIGMGGATSKPTASVCTQYTIIQTVNATQNSIMNLSASDGTSIITFKFPRTLSSACMLLSAPGIANGTYVLKTGGSCDGTDWNGYYANGTYSGGSQAASITVSSIVTGGSTGGPGGGGGGRP